MIIIMIKKKTDWLFFSEAHVFKNLLTNKGNGKKYLIRSFTNKQFSI
jgi:hypothetical protein